MFANDLRERVLGPELDIPPQQAHVLGMGVRMGRDGVGGNRRHHLNDAERHNPLQGARNSNKRSAAKRTPTHLNVTSRMQEVHPRKSLAAELARRILTYAVTKAYAVYRFSGGTG